MSERVRHLTLAGAPRRIGSRVLARHLCLSFAGTSAIRGLPRSPIKARLCDRNEKTLWRFEPLSARTITPCTVHSKAAHSGSGARFHAVRGSNLELARHGARSREDRICPDCPAREQRRSRRRDRPQQRRPRAPAACAGAHRRDHGPGQSGVRRGGGEVRAASRRSERCRREQRNAVRSESGLRRIEIGALVSLAR